MKIPLAPHPGTNRKSIKSPKLTHRFLNQVPTLGTSHHGRRHVAIVQLWPGESDRATAVGWLLRDTGVIADGNGTCELLNTIMDGRAAFRMDTLYIGLISAFLLRSSICRIHVPCTLQEIWPVAHVALRPASKAANASMARSCDQCPTTSKRDQTPSTSGEPLQQVWAKSRSF